MTIEPNTLFGSRPPVLPDDDALCKHGYFEQGHQLLTAAGYQQYETSAYANRVISVSTTLIGYWRFGDYLGIIGCGAAKSHSLTDASCAPPKRGIRVGICKGVISKASAMSPEADKPFEFFMNRFRLLEAAPRAEFTQYTGLTEDVIRRQIDEAISRATWSVNAMNTGRLPNTVSCFEFAAGAVSGGGDGW